MTFLCTVDGVLVPGTRENMIVRDGVVYQSWPKPWAMRCDACGFTTAYGTLAYRHKTGSEHICKECAAGRTPTGQLSLGFVA